MFYVFMVLFFHDEIVFLFLWLFFYDEIGFKIQVHNNSTLFFLNFPQEG